MTRLIRVSPHFSPGFCYNRRYAYPICVTLHQPSHCISKKLSAFSHSMSLMDLVVQPSTLLTDLVCQLSAQDKINPSQSSFSKGGRKRKRASTNLSAIEGLDYLDNSSISTVSRRTPVRNTGYLVRNMFSTISTRKLRTGTIVCVTTFPTLRVERHIFDEDHLRGYQFRDPDHGD